MAAAWARPARARVENQIPKDPVALFCERLKACADRKVR